MSVWQETDTGMIQYFQQFSMENSLIFINIYFLHF